MSRNKKIVPLLISIKDEEVAKEKSNIIITGKKHLSEYLLFADWENLWKQLELIYENEFKTLVFYNLPDIKAIDESIGFIIKSII